MKLLIDYFYENLTNYPEKEILYYQKTENNWLAYKWKEFGDNVIKTIEFLQTQNIKKGDNVAIFSRNMPEWTFIDYALQFVGAVSVPIYSTTSAVQAEYIINETKSKLVFIGEQEQYDVCMSFAKKNSFIDKVIVLDSEVKLTEKILSINYKNVLNQENKDIDISILNKLRKQHQLDDLVTILYTSGTSGEPKGVMLNNRQFAKCIVIHDKRLDTNQDDVSLSFLPLSHVFERGWLAFVISKNIKSYYLRNPRDVINSVAKVKPTLMCAVPRFFEKSYTATIQKVDEFSALKRKIFNWAVSVGTKRLKYIENDLDLPKSLKFKLKLADKLVLEKGRQVLGGKIRFMPCAGAKMSDDVLRFFQSVGINVKYGYGLTETTATVSCFLDRPFKIGSIGVKMPDVEVKIGENNEILVKGETVTPGYYKKPEATKAAFIDGWFRTGDAGYIDEKGNLYMTDRIKDIFKTSSGKYIAPQKIETLLLNNKFIDQIALIGNERKFISALIVPDFENLKEYAQTLNLKTDNNKELINNDLIKLMFEKSIELEQKNLSDFEKVKRFILLPELFSIEGGELTNTLKTRRNFIYEKYKKQIETMYLEE